MKIVSLSPFITQLLSHFGLAQNLAGVSGECAVPDELSSIPRVAFSPQVDSFVPAAEYAGLRGLFGDLQVDFARLIEIAPELLIAHIPGARDNPSLLERVRLQVAQLLGESCRLVVYDPRTLENVFQTYENLGRICGAPDKGLALAHRVRAQAMNWADNFYDRMKNKRVLVVTSLEPLAIGGLWIPDMIHMASAVSLTLAGQDERPFDWGEVPAFRPDVILVAPRGLGLKECLRQFRFFENFPEWEKLPAVKRGEVFFTDGSRYFNTPGPMMMESMGILISAVAGFESGYITERDVFYRQRWLELHRHRLEQ